MVFFPAGIYERADIYHTGISVTVLYISAVYTKESQRKKTGSVEHPSGKYDRISGIHTCPLFQTSGRFLENYDIRILLYQYLSRSGGKKYDQNGTSSD